MVPSERIASPVFASTLALILGCPTMACGGDDDAGDDHSGDDTTTDGTTTDGTGTTGGSSTGSPGGTETGGAGSDGSTSGGSSTGTAGGGTTDGVGFAPPPDVGGAGELCDAQVQDCPEGQKCTAVGRTRWDENRCVPVSGTGAAGDPCTMEVRYSGLDDCGVGLICLFTDDSGSNGTCTSFCEDWACGSGFQCSPFNAGVLPVCLQDCSPLLQDCPNGLGCFPTAAEGQFACLSTSADDGEGGKGQSCGGTAVNDCQPGLVCAYPGWVETCPNSYCCSNYCPVSEGASNCDGTEECLSIWLSAPPPGLEDLGVCRVAG